MTTKLRPTNNITFFTISALSLFFCFITELSAQEVAKEISRSIYLTANVGSAGSDHTDSVLKAIVTASQEDEEPVFLSLGNNTSEQGYPKKGDKRLAEEAFLRKRLLDPLKDFNGDIIFIPGKNEWNKGGHKNIDDLESFLQDNSKGKFWPNDGCPIERETLSDEVELVMVDSQWYLEDWDNYPYINNDCEIKTRAQFMAAFKDELKDEQNKTIIVAVHHPVLTSTRQGFFGRMGGFSDQSYYHNDMQYFVGQLETLASQFEDVIFVSGGDKNLQFLLDDGIPQIISGSIGRTNSVRPKIKKGDFGTGEPGYAKLNVYKDGSSNVMIYTVSNGESSLAFSKDIKLKKGDASDYSFDGNSDLGKTHKASIYTKEETDKSGIYKWFWGDHHRQLYSKEIEAPVLLLENLPDNVRAITSGGGNQSRTLRLIDDNEHEYSLRELRKSAVRFIQSSIADHYVMELMRNTVAEDIVQDYYTTAHPYAPFATASLMDALDIPHANPKIYYVPKQKELGRFNESYGDKLYMLEEHVGDENKAFETFGSPEDIISTSDFLIELQEDKDTRIDEEAYIKARLFDMLVGDWDRHADQWRWALHTQDDGTKLYKPIPRDRDNAFPKYDGVFPAIMKLAAPITRNMQSYSNTEPNVKWLNHAGFYLDQSFINSADWETWKSQATYIQNNLTDEVIDNAFDTLLADTQDESINEIKENLKIRRDKLTDLAQDYFEYFKKHEIIVGTSKDNTVEIMRQEDGKTSVLIKEDDTVILSNTYDRKTTKEIWLYTLDGDDTITIKGDGNSPIRLKIFGGEENDVYDFENARNTTIYDYKSKKNTFKNVGSKRLTDAYEINNYDPKKTKYTTNVILPSAGFDRDSGFNAGIVNTFTTYSLLRNPFTTEHSIGVNYYAATQGLEFKYRGEFAHIFYNWNLVLDGRYTSDNYAINFFGIGNETTYDNDAVDLDFNRTKIKQWHVAPSLVFKKHQDFTGYIQTSISSFEVGDTDNGFAQQFFAPADDVFENQMYLGGEVGVEYNNKRTLISLPRRGMALGLRAGYKQSINEDFDNEFAYVKPMISLVYPIHVSGVATLATKAQAQFNIGDKYEFYHAAMIGGNTSIRALRNDRFQGKSSFFQSTDLRVGIAQFRTGYVPLRLGVTAGFDYGRVWTENDSSEKWHNGYGGSVFINGFKAITANIGYYTSSEDSRLIVSAGFRF
ncbi:metallophosphatase [Dokdonia sinensis]|uniref:Metallophosphatase n=1 Tax=Dokdonia sinensis TaxID=2479847 RepID=A0A3M0GIS1_9FLAO|nr:metallophosphatase [Dokdonia sinensis]RMB64168.1 metallophosphatase [Dokdonia sinensis]